MTSLPVLNTQPIEKQSLTEDGQLDIVEVWYTLQGEGPFAGRPAIFIRVAGCNLDCQLCDTDYTTNRKMVGVESVLAEVLSRNSAGCNLVVITGGEPFRQNITPLTKALLGAGFEVQIETNGTLYLDGFPYLEHGVELVCSPKTPNLNLRLASYVHHLKYILEAGKVASDGLPTESLGAGTPPCRPWSFFRGTVWVQPQDDKDPDKNKANLDAAVQSVLMGGNRRLSVQVHKSAGLP